MSTLTFSGSVHVARSPQEVYALVSDVTRTGEWSPVCRACWWDEGEGPRAGSWFTGRNVTPARTWETRSLVEVAEPGVSFGWLVGGRLARWRYDLAPAGDGTLLTESWKFLPPGLELFAERYGEDADAQVADRVRAAREGIPATLSAIRRVAERGEQPAREGRRA